MRVVIYARVSTDEQTEGYSIDAQLRACREWANQHSHSVMAEYVEEGKSGSTIKKRPQLSELLEEAQQKKFDLVVIHKLDRLSRNLKDTLQIISVFETYGVTLSSVSESFDFSTPIGRMVLTLLVSFAQFFLENLSNEIRKGNLEKAKQGYWHGKIAPPGYRMVDGKLIVHEQEKALIIRAFDLFSTGTITVGELTTKLAEEGLFVYDPEPRKITHRILCTALKNRIYLGEIVLGAKSNVGRKWYEKQFITYPGKHEAFIDSRLFAKVQEMLETKHFGGKGVHNVYRGYVFGGRILKCAVCGSVLVACANKTRGYVRYRCDAERDGEHCAARPRQIQEHFLLDEMSRVIAGIELPDEWKDEIKRRTIQPDTVNSNRRDKLERRRKRLSSLYLNERVGEEEYWEEDKRIEKELKSLTTTLVTPEELRQSAEILISFPVIWPKATNEERRSIVRLMFREIVVDITGKRIVAFKPTPSFGILFNVGEDGCVKRGG